MFAGHIINNVYIFNLYSQDGTGIQTKRQNRHRSTKNKMERSTACSRLSFHRTGLRCPTSVYVHSDDDDNDIINDNNLSSVVSIIGQ